MSLTLYFHPLSSFCHKVLIALYENATPFAPQIVDLGSAAAFAEFKTLWPIGKIPVLRDEALGQTIPETSIIIEYLDRHYPGRTRFIPQDPDLARETRMRDRFYDLYVNVPMQKIVTDRIRPPGRNDPHGVEDAKALLTIAIGMIDREMASRTWAMGDGFTLADCAAAPPLFYANVVMPFAGAWPHALAYLNRLMERPSYARILKETEPYFHMFPRLPSERLPGAGKAAAE